MEGTVNPELIKDGKFCVVAPAAKGFLKYVRKEPTFLFKNVFEALNMVRALPFELVVNFRNRRYV